MLVFLEVNDITLNYTQDELVDFGLSIADGSMNQNHIIDWIYNHL
jgi:death-on-curing protein